MIIICRLPALYDMGISPLSLLIALSGGSGQLLFVLVDHKQLSQAVWLYTRTAWWQNQLSGG